MRGEREREREREMSQVLRNSIIRSKILTFVLLLSHFHSLRNTETKVKVREKYINNTILRYFVSYITENKPIFHIIIAKKHYNIERKSISFIAEILIIVELREKI